LAEDEEDGGRAEGKTRIFGCILQFREKLSHGTCNERDRYSAKAAATAAILQQNLCNIYEHIEQSSSQLKEML
jgi:hypothetical protein